MWAFPDDRRRCRPARMAEWMEEARRANVSIEPVHPSRLEVSGFDPHEHFSEWRRKQNEWSAGKLERIERAYTRAAALRVDGLTHGAIADQLNREQLPSGTAKLWTADNVGELLKGTHRPSPWRFTGEGGAPTARGLGANVEAGMLAAQKFPSPNVALGMASLRRQV